MLLSTALVFSAHVNRAFRSVFMTVRMGMTVYFVCQSYIAQGGVDSQNETTVSHNAVNSFPWVQKQMVLKHVVSGEDNFHHIGVRFRHCHGCVFSHSSNTQLLVSPLSLTSNDMRQRLGISDPRSYFDKLTRVRGGQWNGSRKKYLHGKPPEGLFIFSIKIIFLSSSCTQMGFSEMVTGS